jgi:hypothetical protein
LKNAGKGNIETKNAKKMAGIERKLEGGEKNQLEKAGKILSQIFSNKREAE